MKVCYKCKIKKLKSEFYKYKDGLYSWCKVCTKEIAKKYRQTTKGILVRQEYRNKNRDKIKEQRRVWNINNPGRNRQKERESLYKIKTQVLTHYSTMSSIPVCAHPDCLVMNIDMLCIDHIDNNGNEHRRNIKRGNIYRWLFVNKFPPGFQILCWNHNYIKEIARRRRRKYK